MLLAAESDQRMRIGQPLALAVAMVGAPCLGARDRDRGQAFGAGIHERLFGADDR